MHIDDMNTIYSATWSSTLTSDIIYNCSTVYLAILITVGVALNSRAMSLLMDFNKVRELVFRGKTHLKFLILLKLNVTLVLRFKWILLPLQAHKTEQTLMFMNLIASELAIAVLLLLDFLGSYTRGKIYERNSTICTMSGFTHSFFCKQ